MKNTKSISVAIIAVVIAAVAIGAGVYVKDHTNKNSSNNAMSNMDAHSSMYDQYAALKGGAYDQQFVAGMIAHHQGAVDMAKLALTNAKHSELKDMANNIIAAQEKEITEMTTWQTQWGYPASSGSEMSDHSAMGMENDMATMTNDLKDKTGDDFDKSFLSLMIQHHQSAIDMSRPGASNAKHQEVKDLTKGIIAAQSSEIAQMKQWQKEWGY